MLVADLSCGHIPIHSISISTNYVDQLDKPQSVSLGHLALLPRGVESYQGTPMGNILTTNYVYMLLWGEKILKIFVN